MTLLLQRPRLFNSIHRVAVRHSSNPFTVLSKLIIAPNQLPRNNLSLFSKINYHTRLSLLKANNKEKILAVKHPLLIYSLHSSSNPFHSRSTLLCENSFGIWSTIFVLSTIFLLYSATLDETVFSKIQVIKSVHFPKISVDESQVESRKMSSEALPGRPGTLTPEQEDKLKELWTIILQAFGVIDDTSLSADTNQTRLKSENLGSKKLKKKRVTLFKRNKDDENEPEFVPDANNSDDKFGQNKVFNEALANMTPESLRATFWGMIKHDNPDALLLRFLRARQWDIEKAIVMMISTMRWRLMEVHVDDDIIKNGELKALEQSNGADPADKIFGNDFLDQMRLGKSFLHGTDKKGRPLCLVRVRQHRQGEQCEKSLERYTVYLIETARMILAPPIDTASVIFDMTGFSMANMDYTPLKFMIRCFEANYPECLGVILVHKAPWVFQGIWKIIRGWLDPVVAGKVQFTNNVEELEQYVSRSQIIKELGGDEHWEYEYVEPTPGENDKMNDTETRDKLVLEREKIFKEYEIVTRSWIHATKDESSNINTKRLEIAKSLRDDYWNLDPYIRARTYYDRTGVINPGGVINYYPSKK